MTEIDISIEDTRWGAREPLHALAAKAVAATFARLDFTDVSSELSLVFTDDATIRQINAEWRRKDKATNVLSFPAFPVQAGEKPGMMLGDIILAYETVKQEAAAEQKPFDHHLMHLLVHGLLHLVGYDHENSDEAERMEQLEREILHSLAIPDPYIVL